MHRIADHFHLVVPVKQEGLECDVLRKFVQFVQLTVPVDTDRTVKVVRVSRIYRNSLSSFRLEDEMNGMLLFVAEFDMGDQFFPFRQL